MTESPQTGPPRVTNLYRGQGGDLLGMDEIQGGGAGSEYWFAQDGLGNISTVTKQSGQSAHDYFYAPFGGILDNNGKPEDSSNWTDPHNHYLLNGKEWDEEMSLYYFGARYYDATTGVWLNQDSYRGEIQKPVTLHRTLYVAANPINYTDAYGYRIIEIEPDEPLNPANSSGGGSTPVSTQSPVPSNPTTRDPYEFKRTQLEDVEVSVPEEDAVPSWERWFSKFHYGPDTDLDIIDRFRSTGEIIHQGPNTIVNFLSVFAGTAPDIPENWRTITVNYRDFFPSNAVTDSAPYQAVNIHYQLEVDLEVDSDGISDLSSSGLLSFEIVARVMLGENTRQFLYDDLRFADEVEEHWPQDQVSHAYIILHNAHRSEETVAEHVGPDRTADPEFDTIHPVAADRAYITALGVEQEWLVDPTFGADWYFHENTNPSFDGAFYRDDTWVGDYEAGLYWQPTYDSSRTIYGNNSIVEMNSSELMPYK